MGHRGTLDQDSLNNERKQQDEPVYRWSLIHNNSRKNQQKQQPQFPSSINQLIKAYSPPEGPPLPGKKQISAIRWEN